MWNILSKLVSVAEQVSLSLHADRISAVEYHIDCCTSTCMIVALATSQKTCVCAGGGGGGSDSLYRCSIRKVRYYYVEL